VSERRPEPVLAPAQLAAFATWITGLAVTWAAHRGWLLPAALAEPIADAVEVALVAAVGTAGTLWASYRARRKVTPLEDPRDVDGTPLVRADAPTSPVPVIELVDPAPAEPAWPDTVEIPVVSPGRHHPTADV
jgi:hypothetical protein